MSVSLTDGERPSTAIQSPDERRQAGAAIRRDVPRSANSEWVLPSDRARPSGDPDQTGQEPDPGTAANSLRTNAGQSLRLPARGDCRDGGGLGSYAVDQHSHAVVW